MEIGLLNRELIASVLMRDAPWSDGHGAHGDYLGSGLIYYALVYALRPKVVVCLGSGGGFVPRIMRQAQRDLGMADQARTILVDAVRPEAGWGAPAWLSLDSFFRQQFPEIELVLTTTEVAAGTYFAREGTTIDYLHIDADHTFEGCLRDFWLYRPFLKEGSVVTLHDTHYPTAGVRHVIEHLRTRVDCEVIDFPEMGVGTALLRITGTRRPAPPPTEVTDAVFATRKSAAPAFAPSDSSWHYLKSEAFQSRNALAAHFVKDCPQVVELGGGAMPIDRFLTGSHSSVIVVDPLIREERRDTLNDRPCTVWHARARFQDLDWTLVRPHGYGLVLLGMDLEGLTESDVCILIELVASAGVTVIEFASSWSAARTLFELLRDHSRTRERFHCRLDLSGNEVGDPHENSWRPRFEREIHLLEPK